MIASLRATGYDRPQDLVDLRSLLAIASAPEQLRARERVALIGARGYARGCDLVTALDDLIGRYAG